jgi:hypothetical protein
MADRRGLRFLVEALFLILLATALAFAKLDGAEVAGIMLVGWAIVAALEWAAWRGEPHFGSGLPPRWYVPSVDLPPAQPLEQVAAGYPEARDEAPTWIAPAALRAEVLGEWPVAARVVNEEPLVEDPWTAVELPAAPLEEPEPVAPLVAAPEATIDIVLARSVQRVARYTLDPLAEPEPRRRFGRGGDARGVPSIEVPARPEGLRVLPGRSSGQD